MSARRAMKVDAIGGFQRYHAALPKAVDLILVALIGVALGRLFWTLVPAPSASTSVVTPAAMKPHTTGANHTANTMASITQAHLFGSAVAKTAQPVHAPKTHLALTLTGILFSRTPQDSIAIIANDKHQQQFYQPGGKVGKGVALHAIYPDRVILKRAGRLETLKLDQGGLAVVKNSPDSRRSGDKKPNLAQIRREIVQQPDSMDQYISLQPVYRSGQVQGYAVYPNLDQAAFFAIGLKPGDVVTAINRIPLSTMENRLRAIDQLSRANKLVIYLKRLGHDHTLTVKLHRKPTYRQSANHEGAAYDIGLGNK